VNSLVTALEATTAVLRIVAFGAAVVVGVVALVDWAVRTRRLNPFGGVGRFMRKNVDPLLVPIERRVVRAGGRPTSAPAWALVTVVIGSLVLLWALQFLTRQLASATGAFAAGPREVLRLLVHWTFLLLQIALLVRVLSTWVRVSPYSRWVRWAYSLTEWFLRPLRRIIPTIGMLDITPIVAYFGLSLLEGLVLSFM
jgi:YggT family protein